MILDLAARYDFEASYFDENSVQNVDENDIIYSKIFISL